jgi:hypothetical protein
LAGVGMLRTFSRNAEMSISFFAVTEFPISPLYQITAYR